MKNFLLFSSIILLSFSCSKKDTLPKPDTFELAGTIDNETVNFSADLCKQEGGGWSGGLTFVEKSCISWITNWKIIDGDKSLFIEFHIKDSLKTMDSNIASNYFFPRELTTDLAPKFFPIVKYSKGNLTYTSIKNRLEGVNPDFTLTIDEANVSYQHECWNSPMLMQLKGTFHGTMFNESNLSETIEMTDGRFDVIMARYDFLEVE